MGSFYFNKRIRSYILIFLIVLSFLVAVPIKKGLSSFIDSTVSQITDEIYEKTGLTISYTSLSPSILTSFSVKGIEISDNEKTVLNIDNVKIKYKLFKLLKKDFQNGITSVLIDGITLDVNQALDIFSLFTNKKSSGNLTFGDIINLIPKNIKLRNLKFLFKNEAVDLVYNIKDISVAGKSQNQALELEIVSVLSGKLLKLNRNIQCRLNANGAVTNNFNNSQLNIKLSDISSKDVKLNKLNFHLAFNNNIIELRTIQVTNPISIGVKYNLDNK